MVSVEFWDNRITNEYKLDQFYCCRWSVFITEIVPNQSIPNKYSPGFYKNTRSRLYLPAWWGRCPHFLQNLLCHRREEPSEPHSDSFCCYCTPAENEKHIWRLGFKGMFWQYNISYKATPYKRRKRRNPLIRVCLVKTISGFLWCLTQRFIFLFVLNDYSTKKRKINTYLLILW